MMRKKKMCERGRERERSQRFSNEMRRERNGEEKKKTFKKEGFAHFDLSFLVMIRQDFSHVVTVSLSLSLSLSF